MSECKLIITIPAFQIEENPVCDTSWFEFQLINLGSTLITASLALKVEDVSLLYIAHSGDISVVSGLYYYSLSAMTKNLDNYAMMYNAERYYMCCKLSFLCYSMR